MFGLKKKSPKKAAAKASLADALKRTDSDSDSEVRAAGAEELPLDNPTKTNDEPLVSGDAAPVTQKPNLKSGVQAARKVLGRFGEKAKGATGGLKKPSFPLGREKRSEAPASAEKKQEKPRKTKASRKASGRPRRSKKAFRLTAKIGGQPYLFEMRPEGLKRVDAGADYQGSLLAVRDADVMVTLAKSSQRPQPLAMRKIGSKACLIRGLSPKNYHATVAGEERHLDFPNAKLAVASSFPEHWVKTQKINLPALLGVYLPGDAPLLLAWGVDAEGTRPPQVVAGISSESEAGAQLESLAMQGYEGMPTHLVDYADLYAFLPKIKYWPLPDEWRGYKKTHLSAVALALAAVPGGLGYLTSSYLEMGYQKNQEQVRQLNSTTQQERQRIALINQHLPSYAEKESVDWSSALKRAEDAWRPGLKATVRVSADGPDTLSIYIDERDPYALYRPELVAYLTTLEIEGWSRHAVRLTPEGERYEIEFQR